MNLDKFNSYEFVFFLVLMMAVFNACDCGTDVNVSEQGKIKQNENSSSNKVYPDSFKPNDEEFPYANLPRIVIETENRKKVKDRETEIPAKLQIWGMKEAESEIVDLTIRGRGNSTWEMPKKSYKIEFVKKSQCLVCQKTKTGP